MKPDLQFSVLCDDVRREDNGKLMLIGLHEVIGGFEYPMAYPGMAVVNRWCNGVGQFTQRMRLMDPENRAVLETPDSPVSLPDLRAAVTVVAVLRNVLIPKPGRYAVEVLLDGELKQRYALDAVLLRPANPDRPPGGPPPSPRP